jgi:hypothetical protein
MPAVRQNRSKLILTCCQASSTIVAGTTAANVVDFFMLTTHQISLTDRIGM